MGDTGEQIFSRVNNENMFTGHKIFTFKGLLQITQSDSHLDGQMGKLRPQGEKGLSQGHIMS